MEVVLYGAITTVWWISSMTVLLPLVLLLKFSKSFQNRWFSFLFVRVWGPIYTPRFVPLRKRAFELLKENLAESRENTSLEILEIGIGSGANLQFYPENSNLTALDMNETFGTYFSENQKKYPQVTYKRTVIAMAEDMPQVTDSSMDIVVCTLVLCSVHSMDSVLTEVKRVLKPGGKFLFLEHVAFPKTEWGLTVQRFASPLWQLYFDGCFLDRDIAEHIYKAGFSDVVSENMHPKSLMMYVRPLIVGVATK